jgi:glycerol uptake facilitator-like aquaporin
VDSTVPIRRLAAECLGTAFLLATIVGSGIMGERLSGSNEALALLCNSLATGAILIVLISVFGQVSGAHLNPAVTLAFMVRREIGPTMAVAYMGSQLVGAVAGTLAAHVMFEACVRLAHSAVHGSRSAMSALGHKLTSARYLGMSALPPKADFLSVEVDVC